MPGPATIFTTLGAVGACGAAAYVTKNQYPAASILVSSSKSEIPQRNQDNRIISNRAENNKISKISSTNKKLRLGHRNDLHVLMFVMGKD